MRLLGNIIWLIFGGLESALCLLLAGIIFCITIVGIPFGTQLFKFAELMLTPFGKDVDTNYSKHPLINLIWCIIVGWWGAILFIGLGLLYCITIIGIPFGKQWFKFAQLILFPFGATID